MNQNTLPKLGDKLMRVMSTTNFLTCDDIPEECVVVYVNEPHKYYTVEFTNTKIRQSYKVPDVDEIRDFKNDYQKAYGISPKGVYVYESGVLYPSISACARDIGVSIGTVSRHVHGKSTNVKGYHIILL